MRQTLLQVVINIEKEGIKDFRSKLKEQLWKLCRAEHLRQQRRMKEKRRAQFLKDLYGFKKTLLSQTVISLL